MMMTATIQAKHKNDQSVVNTPSMAEPTNDQFVPFLEYKDEDSHFDLRNGRMVPMRRLQIIIKKIKT